MKNFLFIVVVLLAVVFQERSASAERLKVLATLYPLAHFAEQVGGSSVSVTNVVPPGSEPHEFEPTPGDIRKIYESTIFLMNGAGLEMWAEKLLGELRKKNVLVVTVSQQISSLDPPVGGRIRDRLSTDPHLWLDPLLAAEVVEILRNVFIRADPERADAYRANSLAYRKKLYHLHEKYRQGLATCKIRDIIVSHDAYYYLARRYDLQTHAISGLSPDEEPSPRKMVELTEIAKNRGVRYIFFESLVNPRIARTIAREAGAETRLLHSLGGLTEQEVMEGKTYLSIMEENLDALRVALSCNS